MKQKLDLQTITNMITDYNNGESSIKLAKIYNLHQSSIIRCLRRNGVYIRNNSEKGRKYQIKETFFDEIDTQEKAYVLGLIYADGSVNLSSNSVEISLIESDQELLKKISELIYVSYKPLYYKKAKQTLIFGKPYLCKPQYTLNIINKHIANHMPELGVTERKSLVITFPHWLKEDLYPHFIRGYFDGDGCLSHNSHSKSLDHIFFLLGTQSFLETVQAILNKKCLNTSKIIQRGKIFQLSVTGNKQIYRILSFLYENSSIHMNRKYEKFVYLKSLQK